MSCPCSIIPAVVFERLSKDPDLSEELRRGMEQAARTSAHLRKLRLQAVELTRITSAAGGVRGVLAPSPAVTVYDCKHTHHLPGSSVHNPASSRDQTAVRTFTETTAVADFYKQVFNRNSIDDASMTLMSSIHYGVKYNNAMWNGSQMVYGDGDDQIFIDFTHGNDVIGHELTHGVIQYTLQLGYRGDAGGLNESLSDCFGSMFRQWQANQDVNTADWLIGHDILGPIALGKGYTCLRNMADPADPRCLAPQPVHYSQLTPGMDPHLSSGPANLAFTLTCKAVGGKSWEKVGQIWYRAMTGFPSSPRMKMKAFADHTRLLAGQMYAASPVVATAVDAAWKQAGI